MQSASLNYRQRLGAWVKDRLVRNPAALKIDCEGLDLFIVRDVITADESRQIIDLMEQHMAPSGLLGPTDDPDFRTSHSSNPDPQHPVMKLLETRLHEVVGIQPELGETVQGQRYHVGQQFKAHFDWLATDQPYWPLEERSGGQRTWTAMMFLNEPEAGGHTTFPEVGVSVRPRTGNLLVWNNLTPEGEENKLSMHCGSPVTAGVKYVVTKWYRERPWVAHPPGEGHVHY
jgi:prolyl 4-hydroxylase